MATFRIADNLDVTTQVVQGNPSGRMGVEVSQPVVVVGHDVVSVAGEVTAVQRTSESCFLEVQQSLDSRKWMLVQRIALPTLPGPFALTDVPVSLVFARVRYVVEGPMTAATRWQVTATLSAGET
jgi:hypothetical protein